MRHPSIDLVRHEWRGPRRALGAVLALGCAALLGACDDLLSVDNETNILDEDLSSELAVTAVVNGVAGDLAYAYSYLAYMSSQLADEMIHTGSDSGIRGPSEGDTRTTKTWAGRAYDRPVVAAFTADDAVRRFREVLPDADSHPATARALIYGGFTYLMLADNMCAVTLNGGPPMEPDAVYPMAEEHFTEGLAIATAANEADLQRQALAGRARARLAQGDFAGARADAREIPEGFVMLAYYSENSNREWNTYASQSRADIRKESGVRSNFYNNPLYQDDPRVPFTNRGPEFVGADGLRQFVEQDKYPSRASDMRLASWQEARLIEAEAEIGLGNLARAVELINEVRGAAGLAPYAGAATADAVFAQLIFERSAELWLEGQRLRDLRRTNDPFLQGRDSCYPISITEEFSNPHV